MTNQSWSDTTNGSRSTLTGAEKAAILLMYAGPEASSRIFQHLEADEIKKIVAAMARLGQVTPDKVDAVVHEFAGDLQWQETQVWAAEPSPHQSLVQTPEKAAGVVEAWL